MKIEDVRKIYKDYKQYRSVVSSVICDLCEHIFEIADAIYYMEELDEVRKSQIQYVEQTSNDFQDRSGRIGANNTKLFKSKTNKK